LKEKLLVWDLPLRLFHWLFALTIFAAWYTSEQEGELIDLHMQLGYFAIGLIVFRLIWGLVGTRHSRFSQFLPTPARLTAYLKGRDRQADVSYAGHNPLGSLMVILMIVLVSLQAISGLFINDDVFSSGPYYGSVGSEIEAIMEFLHHNTFDLMLISIALHISAIGYYWWVKKHNLVKPMITGRKPADLVAEQDSIPHSRLLLALLVAALVAGFVYWLVVINAPVVEEFYY